MFGEKHENEHLKTEPIKKFKFINRDKVPIRITSDLEYEFNELRECLKSENVDLTMDDILKVFDIYLRVSGIGRSLEDATEFQSIFSQCAPVRCIDPCIDANEEKINNIKNYIKKYRCIYV